MLKKIAILILFLAAAYVRAQTAALPGFCVNGATPSATSGLHSTNYLQGIIPRCLVQVFLTGTTTPATIYKDGLSTPLTNPFTANADGSWLFFAAINQGYDVLLSGGVPPNTYGVPRTLTAVYPSMSITSGCGFGTACPIPQGGTGATTAAAALANLGAAGWLTGVGAPVLTCSAGTNNGYFYTSSTLNLYQCSNVGGSYVWNFLGGSAAGSISGQATGVLPLPCAPTTICGQSHVDDGVTTAGVVTVSEPLTANANKVLYVKAPPYNAQCDLSQQSSTLTISTGGVTSGITFLSTDRFKWITGLQITGGTSTGYAGQILSVSGGNATMSVSPGSTFTTTHWYYGHNDYGTTTNGGIGSGISQAFADAASTGASVQFPAGTCLTSTILFTGQNFFGAGDAISIVQSLPALFAFLGPDGGVYSQKAHLHDIQIRTDNSINASSTQTGGNGTFPNYFTGTAGGIYFALTAAANASGGNTVYTGTIVSGSFSGASNSLVGKFLTVIGFSNAGNNVTHASVVASSATSVTLVNAGGIAESASAQIIPEPLSAANGGPPAPGSQVFGSSINGGCSGNTSTSTPTLFNMACANFQSTYPQYVYGAPITINGAGVQSSGTSWAITGTAPNQIVTFQVSNSFTAGEIVYIPTAANGGCPTSTFFNDHYFTVLSAGLTGSAFAASFTHANSTGTENCVISAPYTGTISSINSQSQVVVSPSIATSVTTGSGSWGTGIQPPWGIGNCGIGVPETLSNTNNGPTGWTIDHVWFTTTSNLVGNDSCAALISAQSNNITWDHVQVQFIDRGIIEYLPIPGPGAFTPDTNNYTDIYVTATIPMVMYNGAHRSFHGYNVLNGGNPFALGTFWFNTQTGSGTIDQYYNECLSNGSGEQARFDPSVSLTIEGGSLTQCGMSQQYVNFGANNVVSNAEITSLHVRGSHDLFRGTNATVTSIVDSGVGNSIETAPGGLQPISTVINRPRPALGYVDASFLGLGLFNSPIINLNDGLKTCQDFNFAQTNTGTGGPPGCTSNLSDSASYFGSYIHMTTAGYASGWCLGVCSGVGQGNLSDAEQLIVGKQVPQAKDTLYVQGRCPTASTTCTQTTSVYDTTASSTLLATGTLTYNPAWTNQTLAFDASAVTLGHVITVVTAVASGTSVTTQDISAIGFSSFTGLTTTGSPTSGQTAQFSGANTVTGVANTGTGSYVLAAGSPAFTGTPSSSGVFTGTGNVTSLAQPGAFLAQATSPSYVWDATGQGTDQKYWDARLSGLHWELFADNDAYNSSNAAMDVFRGTGTTITSVTFNGTVVGNQTLASLAQPGAFFAKAARPGYVYEATGQGTDQKFWTTETNGLNWLLESVNDAYSSTVPAMTVARGTGTAIGAITFGGTGVGLPSGSTLNSNAILTTAGTGLSTSTNTVSSNAVYQLSFQPGLLTAVVGTTAVYSKVSKASTVDNLTGAAMQFTCGTNPTITMYECGTSTTCASPTTIGTVTVTASGTATVGTVSNAAITAGDYVGWALTAGVCTTLDISANAQVHSN